MRVSMSERTSEAGGEAYRMAQRKVVKVMLPCVMEFQLEKEYLRSGGRPMKDQRTLRGG